MYLASNTFFRFLFDDGGTMLLVKAVCISGGLIVGPQLVYDAG